MAGQEIEGGLWDRYLGVGLLPPSERVGFTTLFPTSVQNLGSRDPRLTKLALDQACIKNDDLCTSRRQKSKKNAKKI